VIGDTEFNQKQGCGGGGPCFTGKKLSMSIVSVHFAKTPLANWGIDSQYCVPWKQLLATENL